LPDSPDDWAILAKQIGTLSRQLAGALERIESLEGAIRGQPGVTPTGRNYVREPDLREMFPMSRATFFRMLKKYPPSVLHRKYAGRSLLIDAVSFEECLPDFTAKIDQVDCSNVRRRAA